MPLDTNKVLQQYSQYERIQLQPFGAEKVVENGIVKFVAPDKEGSYISYADIDSQLLNQRIAEQVEYFKVRGKSFEWKVYASDAAPELPQALVKQGFVAGDEEAFMVLVMPSEVAPQQQVCVKIKGEKGVIDALSVQQQVWQRNYDSYAEELIGRLQQQPESLSMFVVYAGAKPVASAWITYTANSPFAGLWGGSTLPEYRCRGYYSDLLLARSHEAKAKGIKYLTIDASPMSRPIVAKFGFEYITSTWGYDYVVS